jgi:hypothetical protein
MIVLQELATSQTFKIIPQSLAATSMIITDESEGISVTYAITPTVDRYYLSISKVVNLIEGRYYTIAVLDGVTNVFNGVIFCTNQTISDYSINDGAYVQNSTNNDFIII